MSLSNSSHAQKLEKLIAFHRKTLILRDQGKFSESACLETAQIMDAERVTIFLIDFERRELFAKFATGLNASQIKALRFPVGAGISGHVAQTGVLVNAPEAQKDPHFNVLFDVMLRFETRSILAVPLKDISGRVMGVLAVYNKTAQGTFDKGDEGILELIASQLAATYETLDLLDNLKLAGRESIFALAQTAEFRDQQDTGPHINRMSVFAAMLAEYIGLAPQAVEIIRITSPLHDIGKVAIPDHILKKPGKFTPEEFEEMKKHTQYGFEMLKNFQSPLLKAASKIAIAHHEKFDGSGYPKGLKGDAIPLEARIVTLADSFDAMSSRRVYKSAMLFEDAAKEIERCAKTQFDPVLVEAFLKHKAEFKAAMLEGHKED